MHKTFKSQTPPNLNPCTLKRTANSDVAHLQKDSKFGCGVNALCTALWSILECQGASAEGLKLVSVIRKQICVFEGHRCCKVVGKESQKKVRGRL